MNRAELGSEVDRERDLGEVFRRPEGHENLK